MLNIVIAAAAVGSFYLMWKSRAEAEAERNAKHRAMKEAAELYNEQKQRADEAYAEAAVLLGVAKDALRDGLGENKP